MPRGGPPTALSRILTEIVMFLRGPLGPVNLLKVGCRGGCRGGCRVGAGGVGAFPKLIAKAKSDENERRLRVGDLTRPGPLARRIRYISISLYIYWSGQA